MKYINRREPREKKVTHKFDALRNTLAGRSIIATQKKLECLVRAIGSLEIEMLVANLTKRNS